MTFKSGERSAKARPHEATAGARTEVPKGPYMSANGRFADANLSADGADPTVEIVER